MEELQKKAGSIGHRISHAAEYAAATTLGNYLKEKQIHTPDGVAKEYLRLINVEPTYVKSNETNFAEMRERLNSEPGILISNHPGVADTPLLLQMLHRTDILSLAGGRMTKRLGAIFGEDKILPRTNDPKENLRQFRTIQRHVAGGGLFFLFPTGGEENPFVFRDGFRVIVERILRPTDMVYSAWVDPSDIQIVRQDKNFRNIGAISSMLIPNVKAPAMTEKRSVRVDEHYSQAAEWKEVLTKQKDDAVKNELLTQQYLQTFNQEAYPLSGEKKS